MVKSFHLALWLFVLPVLSIAQISNVSYRLSFNPVTNLYDVYLHVNEGNAKKVKERVQLNAQLTLLVPAGSEVEVAQSYMPLQDNQSYNGTKPMNWSKANAVKKPASDPFHDYVSIVPQLSPASFYNDLHAGDQVKLFSLRISHVANCGDDVRLYNNAQDPASTEVGMAGGDFSNGFTLGGVRQKYTQNEATVTPAIDVIEQILVNTKKGIHIEAVSTEDGKFGPYTYEWRTPFNMPINGKTFRIENPSMSEYGEYQLIVTDARGCKQMKTVEVKTDAANPVHELANGEKNNGQPQFMENKENGQNVAASQVTIYPNPASSEFFINLETEIGTKIDLLLTDASGRNIVKNIVSTVAYETNLNVHVPADDLQPGAYMVLARMNGKESAHKVIIVK